MNSFALQAPVRHIPEVVRAVLVGHDYDSQLGVAFNRVNTIRGVREMFADIRT